MVLSDSFPVSSWNARRKSGRTSRNTFVDADSFSYPPANLPLLHSGETLYSWCGHVHRWNGNVNALSTSRQLFGVPYAGLLHDFPSHLDVLVARTSGQIGTAPDLALQHTLLGYFLPFASPETANTLLASIRSGSVPQLKYKLGIPASRIGACHPLKGCSECFRQDETAFGSSIWHLAHQYPSTLVCHEHRRPLVIVQDRVTPVHRRDWLLPKFGANLTWKEVAVRDDSHIELLSGLAEFAKSVSKLPPGAVRAQELAWTYQSAAKAHGMLTRGGNLRLDLLITRIRRRYAGLEGLPGFAVLSAIHADWAGLVGTLARKRPRPGHPFKHILLIASLFESWAQFTETYDRVARDPPGWSKADKTPPRVPSRDPRVDEFLNAIRAEGKSIRAAALLVGVSPATGVRWAKIAGIPFTPRTKTLGKTFLNEVRSLLRDGKDKSEILSNAGISAVSLQPADLLGAQQLGPSSPGARRRLRSNTGRVGSFLRR